MKAPVPKNFNRKLPPEGTHVARVVGLIYIGTVKTEWQGIPKDTYKIRLSWELPNERAVFKEGETEKPFVISAEYSFSMGAKANLRPIVEGIIGTSLLDEEAQGFDIEQILGKPCLVSISIKEGKTSKYVIVNSTSALLKGVDCPPQENETKILSYENWNEDYYQSLPDFIKEKVESSKEYQAMKAGSTVSAEDVPF